MPDTTPPGATGAVLRDWIGRSETASDVISAAPCAALAATLDLAAGRPEIGTLLPPLWHWLYFLPVDRASELGTDGHRRRGGFLPPVPLERRMWAGSQFTFHAPLRVGDAVTRVSTIDDVVEKSGRSGALVFVKLRHEIAAHGAPPAITELHDIVYRALPEPDEQPAPVVAAPDAWAWEKRWVPDPVLLFRYSALTFNGHRIHYDRRYVTETEGYPGLVVHGPLIATLLLDLLRQQMPRAELAGFRFRAMRPIFDTQPFSVHGQPQQDGGIRLWARDHEGALAMDATARLR